LIANAPDKCVETERTLKKAQHDEFDPGAFLAKAGEGKTLSRFHKGQIVYAQGDAAESIFYIDKGRIKAGVLSEQGKEAVIAILAAGQFFGEECLKTRPIRVSTTTALEDCVITAVTKAAMLATLRSESNFARFFMTHLLARNNRIEQDLADQFFNSSEKRLARLLLQLANFAEDRGPQRLGIQISQATLAEMIGTTRSRVSHFMNKFRKLGLIDYNGEIEVHDSLLHAVLSEKPQIHGD
jgi:CRP/FNR family cyclic AMP-dependent transcriptional regulator